MEPSDESLLYVTILMKFMLILSYNVYLLTDVLKKAH